MSIDEELIERHEITVAAMAAIGTDAPEDWKFEPSKHADAFPVEAGPLRRLLEQSTFDELIREFETADKKATRARDWYKVLAGRSADLSLIAVILAAALLVFSIWDPLGISLRENLIWFAIGQGVCLALSFAFSIGVSRAGLFEAWMTERATAESARIRFFNTISSQTQEPQTGELPTIALQLEYFRRYQLDVQRKYYFDRGNEHGRASWRASVFRWIAFVLIAAAATPVIAILTGHDLDLALTSVGLPEMSNLEIRERIFIAASTTGAAIQGWLASMALINQDERNAARYAATAKNLEALAERPLEEARDAAATGDEKDVKTLIALVQEQISSEHREWVDLRRLAPNLSLERLKDLSLPRMG